MKHLFFSLCTMLLCYGCQSQPGKETALKQKTVLESLAPGTVAAASGSWTMTAKVDGKAWTASSLMVPDAAGRIIGYYKGGYISLPYPRNRMQAGKKIVFSKSNAVDYWKGEGNPIEAGYEGNMEVTKVNGDWVEGNFQVTVVTDAGQRITVTEGFFRVSTAKHA